MLTGNRPMKATAPPALEPSAASGTDPSGSASVWNAPTSWTQIDASAAEDYLLTGISYGTTGTSTAAECELYIALGAAAAEVVIVTVPLSLAASLATSKRIDFPIPVLIPSGSRISCGDSGSTGTRNRPANVKLELMPAADLLPA